jgi:hypothetical protein
MRFRTWNVGSLFMEDQLKIVARELAKGEYADLVWEYMSDGTGVAQKQQIIHTPMEME